MEPRKTRGRKNSCQLLPDSQGHPSHSHSPWGRGQGCPQVRSTSLVLGTCGCLHPPAPQLVLLARCLPQRFASSDSGSSCQTQRLMFWLPHPDFRLEATRQCWPQGMVCPTTVPLVSLSGGMASPKLRAAVQCWDRAGKHSVDVPVPRVGIPCPVQGCYSPQCGDMPLHSGVTLWCLVQSLASFRHKDAWYLYPSMAVAWALE